MNDSITRPMIENAISFDSRYALVTIILGILLVLIPARGVLSYEKNEFQETKYVLPQDDLSVGALVRYAYENSPAIKESRESWNASIETYRIQTGYPDPKLMVTYFPDPIETRLGPQDWNASISQNIPFPGKLSKAGRVATSDANIARIRLDQAIRDVIISIRESVYELYYIRTAKQIARQNEKLLDHLRKVTETQYAQGSVALVDVVKAQSQVGQLRYDMLLLDDLEMTEITQLNSILNRSPEAFIGQIRFEKAVDIVFSLEEIYKMAQDHQEEIKMASERIKKAQAKTDLARAKNMPDFNLGLFYAAIGEPDVPQPPDDAGRDSIGIQAGITLPLWFGKNKSRVNLARAEKRKAEASKERQINSTRAKIRTLYFRFQNTERIITLYRDDLIPQAAGAMELSETFFKEGQSSFSDFIETQSVWYNFQLALARAQADYGKYIVKIERLVGRDITRLDNGPAIDKTGEEK